MTAILQGSLHTRYKCRRCSILDKRKQREESVTGIRRPNDGDGDETSPEFSTGRHTFAIHNAKVAHKNNGRYIRPRDTETSDIQAGESNKLLAFLRTRLAIAPQESTSQESD